MARIQLADNLYLYRVEGPSQLNALVFVNGTKALLVDPGFPEQAKELRAALEADGLKTEIVINSHYHPDHITGNYVFSDCKFMGSEHYKQNYELYEALNPDVKFVKPIMLLKNGQIFRYGGFELNFLNFGGHCKELLAIVINKSIFFIADLLMLHNNGKYLIPYIGFDGGIDEYTKSLRTIQTMNIFPMIPAHGAILNDQAALDEGIEAYISYMEKLRELGKNAKLDDCLVHPEKFEKIGYHENNLQNVFGW